MSSCVIFFCGKWVYFLRLAMALLVTIGTRNKIRPTKRVPKSGNPIPYFEVAESEYHGGLMELGGIFETITILC